MRRYVRARRRELGEPVDEVFVPQVHEPGIEAEVDWGEAVSRSSSPLAGGGLSVPYRIGVLIMFWLYIVVIVAGLSVYITLAIAG